MVIYNRERRQMFHIAAFYATFIPCNQRLHPGTPYWERCLDCVIEVDLFAGVVSEIGSGLHCDVPFDH